MSLFRWVKNIGKKRKKGDLVPADEVPLDRPASLSEAEHQLEVLRMQMQDRLDYGISTLGVLDIRNEVLKNKVLKTIGVQGSETYQHGIAFASRYKAFMMRLGAYKDGELDQPTPLGLSYRVCVERTLEELNDELDHLERLLVTMPQQFCDDGEDRKES